MSDPYAVDPSVPVPRAPLRAPAVEPGRLRARAAWAVVVGAVGIVVPGGGVAALAMAHSVRAEPNPRGNDGVETRRLTVVAIVLGWVGVAVTVLSLVVFVIAVVALLYGIQSYLGAFGAPR